MCRQRRTARLAARSGSAVVGGPVNAASPGCPRLARCRQAPAKKRRELLAKPDTTAARRAHPEREGWCRGRDGTAGVGYHEQCRAEAHPTGPLGHPGGAAADHLPEPDVDGQLLQAVHSDIPGQVKIILTPVPVLDKFGYDTTILPKDTLIIAVQEGRVTHGATRLALKLEQLELPSGEVIDLRATVGDDAGSSGMKGKVNNHYGKLILGTGLSALLSIGIKTAVGTPGRTSFSAIPYRTRRRTSEQRCKGRPRILSVGNCRCAQRSPFRPARSVP